MAQARVTGTSPKQCVAGSARVVQTPFSAQDRLEDFRSVGLAPGTGSREERKPLAAPADLPVEKAEYGWRKTCLGDGLVPVYQARSLSHGSQSIGDSWTSGYVLPALVKHALGSSAVE